MLDLLVELSGIYIPSIYIFFEHIFFYIFIFFSLTACTVSWYHNNVELKQSVKYMKRYIGDDYTFIINRVKVSKRLKKLFMSAVFLTFSNLL